MCSYLRASLVPFFTAGWVAPLWRVGAYPVGWRACSRGQPLLRHADAADGGDARGDRVGRGRRRAARSRPDRQRALRAGRGAARDGGGGLHARPGRCATRSPSRCTCGRAATRSTCTGLAPAALRGGRAGGALGAVLDGRSTATAGCSRRTPCARRCRAGRPLRAARRGWCASSRRRTSRGGRVWPLDAGAGGAVGRARRGLRAHLDGARLMNAVVASRRARGGVVRRASTPPGSTSRRASARRWARCWPARRTLIDEAWRFKQMLGGAMRQAGIVAAGCLYALDHHVERLADDHANARALADGLAGCRA